MHKCLQCAHLLLAPNEPIIINTKSMQLQVGKLLIIISYCLQFLIGPKMIIYILPYVGEVTFVGGKMFAKRTRSASHLFCCWVKNLNTKAWQIFFPFWISGQLFAFVGLLARRDSSSPKRFMGWHFGFLEKKKLASSNVVTSSWVKYVPSYTCHKEGTMGLPIAYFLPKPSTQRLWSSWQNQNLCSSIPASLDTFKLPT